MPEQLSRRALPITNQPSTEPFETPVIPLGTGGLNLKDAADKIERGQFRILTNLVHRGDGQLTVRSGIHALTSVTGTEHHSVRRLNDPTDASGIRLYGVDTNLYSGTSGALSLVSSGFSGNPLTFVPYRPPLSGEAWMFVADSERMRKVRPDGLDLPIGIAPPDDPCTATPIAVSSKAICRFDATDGSQASAWTANPGFDYDETPVATDPGVTTDFPGIVDTHVGFLTQPGGAVTSLTGYYSYWNLPKALDLTTINGGSATDDDIIHIWLKMSHPDLITEVRLYFVCSNTFDTVVLPGTGQAGENGDFFMHSFRTHDFAQALAARQAMVDAAETARVHTLRDEDLERRRIEDARSTWAARRAERDPARSRTEQAGAGVQTWVEYGIIGVPLRRGDFQRFGTSTSQDWNTVSGIVVYVQTAEGTGGPVEFYLDDCYLTGGFNPDTSEPGAQLYDYRYIHYDPRTGAMSNPSPEMTTGIDLLRQSASINPAGSTDSAHRQRIYRRGGSLIADWYFIGQTSSNGGLFTDNIPDAEAGAADTLEFDNYAAIPSVDASGDTVLGQAVPILFGPVEDLLFALGDPNRPGHVAFCKPGLPDMWPATNVVEVCAPSEELMTGGVYNGQAFCFSRERFYLLYPNLSTVSTAVTAVPGACTKGCLSRWGMAVGRGGVYFVAEDGIYRTAGGGPEEKVSEDIDPLFRGTAVEDRLPVDITATRAIRLALHDWDLWFFYQDTEGGRAILVYSILYKFWRAVAFTEKAIIHGYSDEGEGTDVFLLGGLDTGETYTHVGTTDDGLPIDYVARTGDDDFGRPREDKLFGDMILDVDSNEQDTFVTTRLNHSTVVNADQEINGGADRARIILDSFGVLPQKARTLSVELFGTCDTTPPIFYQFGASIIPQPDVTITRVTQWDDLGHPDEVYLTGLTIDVDTGAGAKEFLVEYDIAGEWFTLGPFAVTADNRHKYKFSWAAVKCNLVRIRPIGDCTPWMLYRADWIFDPEPPRIAGWDINHENGWDQYVTGVDLECDTFGLNKVVEVHIDQALVQAYTINASGRRVVHLTVQPPVRGHILRFVATDANPGLLYSHRWHSDPEPSEQTNWNQNYSISGTLGDKWLKAVIFECDTFGQDKLVNLEVDHITVETLTVNTNNRRVVQFSFNQHRGRVFRILPSDANPGRLYSHQLIFDQEPFCFTRWETQEITHGLGGWMVVYEMEVTIRAEADVTLAVTAYRQDGSTTVKEYLLPKTGTAKVKRHIGLEKSKGVLYKYVLTSPTAFWLYREETEVKVAQWGSSQTFTVKPFGNDDLDQTRGMINATIAAEREGGNL